MKSIWQQSLAEFFGTLLFVFVAAGAAIVAGGTGGGFFGVAVAQGLALAIVITSIAHISGGHVNPAVTIGIWVAGKIETSRAVIYIVVQLLGAAAGAALLREAIPQAIWKPASLGATLVNHSAGITDGRAVLLEAVMTFFLVFTVFATAVDDRGAFKSVGGFAIGLVVAADLLVGAVFTGGSMNVARSFGPALLAGKWTDFWVYIAGPVSGGIIAAAVYWLAFLRDREVFAPPSEVPVAATAGDLEPDDDVEPASPEPGTDGS